MKFDAIYRFAGNLLVDLEKTRIYSLNIWGKKIIGLFSYFIIIIFFFFEIASGLGF